MAKEKKETDSQDTIKTSFKIDRDLHLALKQYALIEGKDMAFIVFEEVLKPFLQEKGYYPPRKNSQ